MDRISIRALGAAIRLIREPVVVTYSYPRNHPLNGAGEDCGVFIPMKVWQDMSALLNLPHDMDSYFATDGVRIPEEPARVTKYGDIVDD